MKRLEILKQYRITVEQEFSSIEKRINECINKLDEMDSLEYVENELSEKEIGVKKCVKSKSYNGFGK